MTLCWLSSASCTFLGVLFRSIRDAVVCKGLATLSSGNGSYNRHIPHCWFDHFYKMEWIGFGNRDPHQSISNHCVTVAYQIDEFDFVAQQCLSLVVTWRMYGDTTITMLEIQFKHKVQLSFWRFSLKSRPKNGILLYAFPYERTVHVQVGRVLKHWCGHDIKGSFSNYVQARRK